MQIYLNSGDTFFFAMSLLLADCSVSIVSILHLRLSKSDILQRVPSTLHDVAELQNYYNQKCI